MKKILTSVLFLLLCSTMLMAQSAGTLIFVDKNGNEISDGTTINRQDVAEDDFGEILMHSGLYIKNTSNENTGVRMKCSIISKSASLRAAYPRAQQKHSRHLPA